MSANKEFYKTLSKRSNEGFYVLVQYDHFLLMKQARASQKSFMDITKIRLSFFGNEES